MKALQTPRQSETGDWMAETDLLLLTSAVILPICIANLLPSPDECAADDWLRLSSGRWMPRIGLGTAGLTEPALVERVVSDALDVGYRMIDTADLYENHRQIANALNLTLPRLGLERNQFHFKVSSQHSFIVSLNSREDIFLTTKLRPTDLGDTRCRYAVSRFLEELSTDYLDLLLIHAPVVPPILNMAPSPTQQVKLMHSCFVPG